MVFNMLLFPRGEDMGHNLKDIGERAYISRAMKHLAQKYVSGAIGIAQSTYSSFESGEYDMPISKLMLLCDVLDIDILWLLYGENVQDRQKSSPFCQLNNPDQE
jgi:transcriptional regulator with XRE-family HTH domain